jgi:hypothetical protein
MTGQGGEIVNITRAIDEGRVGAFQIRAIVLCSLVVFLDGLGSKPNKTVARRIG